MEQIVFMKRLRKRLRWTFNQNEINDILADYAGFFESGHAEGKDDAQICASLGDPDAIAAELASALQKMNRPVLLTDIWQQWFTIRRTPGNNTKWLIVTMHLALLVAAANLFGSITVLSRGEFTDLSYMNILLPILIVGTIAFGFGSLLGFMRRSAHFLSTLIHAVGVLVYLIITRNLLMDLTTLDHFNVIFLRNMVIYLAFAVVSILSLLWTVRLPGRKA